VKGAFVGLIIWVEFPPRKEERIFMSIIKEDMPQVHPELNMHTRDQEAEQKPRKLN
jgi:hypothetical protein